MHGPLFKVVRCVIPRKTSPTKPIPMPTELCATCHGQPSVPDTQRHLLESFEKAALNSTSPGKSCDSTGQNISTPASHACKACSKSYEGDFRRGASTWDGKPQTLPCSTSAKPPISSAQGNRQMHRLSSHIRNKAGQSFPMPKSLRSTSTSPEKQYLRREMASDNNFQDAVVTISASPQVR